MRLRPRFLCASVSLGMMLGLALASTASAQTPSGTAVATGLAQPRGVVVGADGTIYVGESGTGGNDSFTAPPPFGPSRGGMTAQITRIGADGSKRVLAGNLPSLVLGPADTIGAKGLALSGNSLYVTLGQTLGDIPPAYSAVVSRVDVASGQVTRFTDVGAIERSANPGGFAVDSNPYGLAVGSDGGLLIADAGGNVLYRADSTGRLTPQAVFPGLPGQMPNPGRNNQPERDPVPTGVGIGRDGSVYVSFLGGFPFVTGGSKIVRIAPDARVSDFATGLNPMTDVEVGPDGWVYAVEFASGFNLQSQPPSWNANSGRVVRISPDGARREAVVSGMTFPNGLAFDAQGRLYVTDNSYHPPQAGTPGRVVRFDVAAPAPAPAAPAPAAPVQVPTQLPRTGDLPSSLPALLGLGALLAGWRLRQRPPRSGSRRS